MNAHQDLTHFAGFDWAGDHHDIIIIDSVGKLIADFKFDHSAPAGSCGLKAPRACNASAAPRR